MKPYKRVFSESDLIEMALPRKPLFENLTREIDISLHKAIMEFSSKHDDGWYLSGGCYTFAYAVGQVLKHYNQKFRYWVMGSGLHFVTEFNKSYWDANGDGSLSDKEYDIYTNEGEDIRWRVEKERNLMDEHNFSLKEAQNIVNELLSYMY